MKDSIGSRIRGERESRHWTQEQLAAVSKVSVRQINRIEHGSTPQKTTLGRLARAFGIDPALLTTAVPGPEWATVVAEYTCPTCGAGLVERGSVPYDDVEVEFEAFACGKTRGWEERLCPKDPRFPAFIEYELQREQFGEDGSWMCFARPLTAAAESVRLERGFGASPEQAAMHVERSYINARYGSEEAERRIPFASLF